MTDPLDNETEAALRELWYTVLQSGSAHEKEAVYLATRRAARALDAVEHARNPPGYRWSNARFCMVPK